jgi:hypothetical protein
MKRLHPLSIMLVDLLPTDLDLHRLEEGMPHRIDVMHIRRSRATHRDRLFQGRKSDCEIRISNQIAISRYRESYPLTLIDLPVGHLLDVLQSKLGVPAKNEPPESDLGTSSEIGILRIDQLDPCALCTGLDCTLNTHLHREACINTRSVSETAP